MRVLVTGGAGFIGSHVVEALLQAGHEVAVVDDLSRGREENLPRSVRFEVLDVASEAFSRFAAGFGPEAIVHQAAQASVSRSVADPMEDARVNILGTLRVLEAARQAGGARVVIASSAAVYGEPRSVPLEEEQPLRPVSPYGLSKWAGERYLELYRNLHGVPGVALRYANVYGPRQDASGEAGVVAIFIDNLLSGRVPTIFGDGLQTRDFVYVGDVARANVLAVEGAVQGSFNVGTGRETTVLELLEGVRTACLEEGPAGGAGDSARARGADGAAGYPGSASEPLALDRCRFEPERPGDIRRSCLKAQRARLELGWEPQVSLLEGLRQTVRWAAGRAGAAAAEAAEKPAGRRLPGTAAGPAPGGLLP